MPNKTIYVKDTDLPLLEQAQEQLGDSVSSMFAEFLRERVAKLTPEENRIIELINEIVMAREALRERSLPEFIDGEYAEAQATRRKLSRAFVRRRFPERKRSSGQPTPTTIGRRAMRRKSATLNERHCLACSEHPRNNLAAESSVADRYSAGSPLKRPPGNGSDEARQRWYGRCERNVALHSTIRHAPCRGTAIWTSSVR